MKLSLGQAAEVRLGRQRSPQFASGDSMVPYLRSANVTDGELNLAHVKTMNFTPFEQSIFSLEEGDVLLTEGSGSRDTVGTSAVWRGEIDGVVCFQNTLLRLRPRQGITDGRYLSWWARHARASGQIAAVSTGANILHIGAEGLKRLRVDVPSIEVQRRIADFLDDRVTRIDKIIAARTSQAEGLHRLFGSMLEETLWTTRQTMPIKHLVRDVTSGPRGWGALVGDEGIPFVRIGNLPALGITLRRTELARVDPPADAESRRASLQRDDVLLSITAAFGQVAVYDADDPAAFSQHVARLRPRDHVDARWMAWTLQTPSLHDQYRLSAYGGTKIGLGLDQVRNLRMPSLPDRTRASSARAVDAAWDRLSTETRAIRTSIALLNEYKQSLITAAVTGEFDVTTASKALPE